MTSDRVDGLSAPAEVFYRRLMSVVDDFGRFDARYTMLKAACFPLRVDTVREADISRWLAECEKAGLIALYAVPRAGSPHWIGISEKAGLSVPVSEKPYVELLDFKQQVRAKQSKYPNPPSEQHPRVACVADDAHLPSIRGAPAPVVEVEVEGEGERARKQTPSNSGPTNGRSRHPPKVPLPDDFGISSRVAAWASDKGYDRLPEYLEAFIGKARASGYRYTDWDAAFMNSIREDWGKVRERQQPKSGPSKRVAL